MYRIARETHVQQVLANESTASAPGTATTTSTTNLPEEEEAFGETHPRRALPQEQRRTTLVAPSSRTIPIPFMRSDSDITQQDEEESGFSVESSALHQDSFADELHEQHQYRLDAIVTGETPPEHKRHWGCLRCLGASADLARRPCYFAFLLVGLLLIGGGIGACIALAASRGDGTDTTDATAGGLQYEGAVCVHQDGDSVACAVEDWPASGYVLVLTDCPKYDVSSLSCPTCPASVTVCGTCAIYRTESIAKLDMDADPKCNSCTVCENGISLNCTNLGTGSCAITDCEQQCIGPG